MNGGLSQDARILRLVDDEYLAERDEADAWLRAREPRYYVDTAEDLQVDEPAEPEPAFPLSLAIVCAIAVALVIIRHAPWAAELLERAAK